MWSGKFHTMCENLPTDSSSCKVIGSYGLENLQGFVSVARSFFELISFVAETLAFLELGHSLLIGRQLPLMLLYSHLGLALFDSTHQQWKPALIGWSLLFVLIARAFTVFPLCSGMRGKKKMKRNQLMRAINQD